MAERLSGTVTFLFTDIEGSTGLLKQLGRGRYGELLTEQQRLLREAFGAHGGKEIDTQGDSFFVAFRSASDAVAAAVAIQRTLADHDWPDGVEVRVRVGIHTGEATASGERYVGFSVHRAARIGDAAHGGQVLLSSTARDLVEDDLPEGVFLRDLGLYRLKDVDRAERISQVCAGGLPVEFPPLRGAERVKAPPVLRRRSVLAAALVGVIAAAVAIPVFALGGGSGGSAAVHLAANSVAAVDSRSGRVVGDVPLTFTPTSVTAGGELIWVLNATGRTVTAIDPKSLQVVRTVGLEGSPFSQWAVGSTDWVALSGALEMVDASGNTSRIALWKPSSALWNQQPCPSVVTGSGRRVWVSQGRRLAELDANGNKLRTQTLPATSGAGPFCYGVRWTGGRLLAARDPDESAGLLDPASGAYTPVATGFAGFTPTGCCWTADRSSLWVGTGNSITQVDAASGEVVSKTPVGGTSGAAGRTSGALVVDRTSGVWALDLAGEKLVQIDRGTTASASQRIPLHHFPSSDPQGVAAGEGRIWIVIQSP